MNPSLFAFVPFAPPDLPEKDKPPRKPFRWRRYIPLALTVYLCIAKIGGASIPLWLCLLPWLLVGYAWLLAFAATIVFCVALLLAYVAVAIHRVVTGEGE